MPINPGGSVQTEMLAKALCRGYGICWDSRGLPAATFDWLHAWPDPRLMVTLVMLWCCDAGPS